MENFTFTITVLLLRLALILAFIRLSEIPAGKNLPQAIRHLLAGIIIGPGLLGGIPLPGFPEGIFGGFMRGPPDLYMFAIIGAIIILFTTGLETNIKLFLRYSIAGSFIGIGGVIFSFLAGSLTGAVLLNLVFTSPQCLFLGIVSTFTSAVIAAGILSNKKKMDSPEGVSILAAAVFDDILGIFGLAAIMVIFSMWNGLAIITGAYAAGLFFSRSGSAPIIRENIRSVHNFFVPVLFAVLGMMVDVREIFTAPVMIFTAAYTLAAVLSKIAGCGIPALLLGYNTAGSLRIGTGLIPRGKITLIIAGMGLVWQIIDQGMYNGIVLMTLLTTVLAAPLLKITLKIRGSGTQRPVKGNDSVTVTWNFSAPEITTLVAGKFLDNLGKEGFYVRMLSRTLSQARKNDISLSIIIEKKLMSISTAGIDMPNIKNAVYEVISDEADSVQKLKETWDPKNAARNLMDRKDMLARITEKCITVDLKSRTKDEVITELAELLAKQGRIKNRDMVLDDIKKREKIMSTGMQHGVALPHAKSDGVSALTAAIGISKEGVDFNSVDGSKSRIIIMMISPRNINGPHVRFLSAISSVLKNENLREALINSATAAEAAGILHKGLKSVPE